MTESSDDFDREVETFGKSERFLAFLDERAKETAAIPIEQVVRDLNTR